MKVLAFAVLVAVCVEVMPEQRHKSHSLHSSTEKRENLFERRKSFKRKAVDENENEMGDTIEEVNKKSGVADSLYQGDILLTREQKDQLELRSKRQAMSVLSRRWPNKKVPYMFSNTNEKVKAAFRKAAQLWRDDTCIDIKEYKHWKEPGFSVNFLDVADGDGCVSQVGKPEEGPQALTLGEGCGTVGIAAHEIGHVLGFFHTQSRYDRDKYITVNEDNIKLDWQAQFGKQEEALNNNYNLTYDYGSIMHYGSRSPNAAIDVNRRVMEAIDGNYTETLGSDIISFYDLLMMNKLYDCLGACANGEPACQNDGFPHPRNCSKCICPSGYGGPLCGEKPSNCGAELEASPNWQTFEKTLDAGEDGEELDEYKRCTYWIKVPDNVGNAKIEVKIADLPDIFSKDGCIFAGVEIKAHPDKRRTGYRFCSKGDVGTVLASNNSLVPVITYSASRTDVFAAKLSYRYTLEEN